MGCFVYSAYMQYRSNSRPSSATTTFAKQNSSDIKYIATPVVVVVVVVTVRTISGKRIKQSEIQCNLYIFWLPPVRAYKCAPPPYIAYIYLLGYYIVLSRYIMVQSSKH